MVTKKVVLSKDESLLEILGNSFFRREGFTLVPVEDGQTGFEAVEAEAPSLAILSFATMGEQAMECCQRIKADPLLNQTAVLLLLEEGADDALSEACWDAGCDALIHQPIAAGRLLDAACGLLGINRRIARRFPVSFQLEFAADEQKTHHATAANLNDGGMFLATDQLFPVETCLRLDFTLPGFQMPITCPVRVAWVNHPEWRKKNTLPCGLGVEFVNLNDVARRALQEFMDGLAVKK